MPHTVGKNGGGASRLLSLFLRSDIGGLTLPVLHSNDYNFLRDNTKLQSNTWRGLWRLLINRFMMYLVVHHVYVGCFYQLSSQKYH